MNANQAPALYPWSGDLEASRDVGSRQRDGFAMLLGWLESFRSRQHLEAGRAACERFWREQVLIKDREPWQLGQWSGAMQWYLRWLRYQRENGREARNLEERVRNAVERAGDWEED
jgi:hypothetical protein